MKPLIMGIVNVTPDSFSDGGKHFEAADALACARRLIAEGADILDIGGESTRPGAALVAAEEEIRRVVPVFRELKQNCSVPLSIDTRKWQVAEAAVEAGANIINDVTGFSDSRMVEVAAKSQCTCVVMHMQGEPQTMQADPQYPAGVVEEVREFLVDRVKALTDAGVAKEKIWIDPGIGFGKTLEHNLRLLKELRSFQGVAARVLIGTSRKSFIAHVLGDPKTPIEERKEGTLASNLYSYEQGASVFRVHEVAGMKRALALWQAIEESETQL